MNSYFLEAPSFDRQRERFLSAARMADASMTEWLHPLKGPREETLVTDVAVLGDPCAPSRLVVLSGTHGVEGFHGSDCQIALLDSLRTHGVPEGVSVVIVHLVNPWGTAWLRRVTEDNVDLNRNYVAFDRPSRLTPVMNRCTQFTCVLNSKARLAALPTQHWRRALPAMAMLQ